MNLKPHIVMASLVASLSLGAIVGCSDAGNNAGGTAQTTVSDSRSSRASTSSPGQTTQSTQTSQAQSQSSDHSNMNMDTGSKSGGASGMSHPMGKKSVQALENLQGKEFDIAFMSQMIAHHQGALDMARKTLPVAKRPETKEEAQKVIDAQTKEIAQMTGWLKSWYSATPDAQQQALIRDDMKNMMAMPINDDKMFYEMMIPHHQGAIEMAELVDHHSQRAELKELAQKIASDQKAEIQKYQQLATMDEEE